MLFSSDKNFDSISIPFNWNADYANGKNYSEYDLTTHRKNDFYLIDRNQVIRFGLFGNGMKFFFEMVDGSFNILKRRIDIEYHCVDGRIIHLTHNFSKKDLITYKEAFTDLSGDIKHQGLQKSYISSINFGYKTKVEKDELLLHFKPIVSLPFQKSAFIETSMSSNKDLDGYLVFKSRNVEVERFYAPTSANKTFRVNWTIK